MNFDLSSLLIGISIALFLRNVIDYSHNTKYSNHDQMGAMINWHYGFLLAWLPIIVIGWMGTILPWWSGFIALLATPFLTFLIFYPVHFFLNALKLIGKTNPKDPR